MIAEIDYEPRLNAECDECEKRFTCWTENKIRLQPIKVDTCRNLNLRNSMRLFANIDKCLAQDMSSKTISLYVDGTCVHFGIITYTKVEYFADRKAQIEIQSEENEVRFM